MATTAPPYTPLAPEQRRLLLAALSSYRKNSGNDAQPNSTSPPASAGAAVPSSLAAQKASAAMSASDGVSPSVFDNSASKTSNDVLYDFPSLDNADFNFDFDDAAAQGRNSIDDSFASFANFDAADAQGEKRKSPEEDEEEDDDDNDPKRHEGDDDKSSKKPGRKPLTSEPTTVSFLLTNGQTQRIDCN